VFCAKKKTVFLGKVVSKEGISVCPKKLDVVRNWPVPSSGDLPNWLNELIAVSRKSGVFQWDTPHQEAFEQQREALSSPPCLAYPRPEGRFILDTDASDIIIGAELSQIQDGVERTIAYASNTLIPTQRNYCTTRKEL
jgi:hypothetical protein